MRRPTSWAGRFALGVVLWLVPVAVVWSLLAPVYNKFLIASAENLVRLTEHPRVTRLLELDDHHLGVTRTDLPSSQGWLDSVRVTDVHFPLILLGALFFAVPGVPLRRRLESLGWALLISVFFHVVSLVFWVKFIYSTQLGEWSSTHYGAWRSNFWGLGKHLLDLPFKFAMPLLLWSGFYLRELSGGSEGSSTPRPAP